MGRRAAQCGLKGLFLLSALATVASAARTFDYGAGRQLLDITTTAFGSQANFTVEVVAPKGSSDSTAQCVFQGYPGYNSSNPVQGPLVVEVPLGGVTNITFGPLTNSAILALYNQTANNTLSTYFNTSYGLVSAQLIANGSTTVGSSAYLTAGRVENYPTNGLYSMPSCLVNVTFVVVPQPPPPPPPSPPPPSGTPGLGDFLSGILGNLSKNPCFCTPVIAGTSSCFNFDQAGTDVNCAPPSSYTCTTVQANAGQFSMAAGPVFQCSTPDVPSVAG